MNESVCNKLLPCAHCGMSDARTVRVVNHDNGIPAWYVECLNCGMRTGEFTEDCANGSDYGTVANATREAIECCVRTWNTRVGNADANNDCGDESPDYFGRRDIMNMLDDLCEMVNKCHNVNKR